MCELLQINRLKHDRKNYLRDINIADVSIANENTTNLVSSYAVRQVADKKGRCAGRIISASAALVIAATVGTTVASVSVTSIATTTASSSTITHFENRKNEQALLQKKMEVKTIVAMPLNSQIVSVSSRILCVFLFQIYFEAKSTTFEPSVEASGICIGYLSILVVKVKY